MIELNLQIIGAEPLQFAVAPTIAFKLQVTNGDPQQSIHNVMLHCQIQIEATARAYGANEKERLFDLFGEPERWGQTVRSLLWTHVNEIVPPFTGETTMDLLVPCTFDFNVSAAKYFAGLSDGEVPICFLFNGTVFYEDDRGSLQVAQIPWEKESNYRLPIAVWQTMMELYYPNQVWLTLRRDVFDRLDDYKRSNGIPLWDQAFEKLLSTEESLRETRLAAGKLQ
jgi:hypothetical protein